LSGWLDTVPPLPMGVRTDDDLAAAARGRALFEGDAGCALCHDGSRRTTGRSADVGTGGIFQIPSLLGVRHRAPFLHDGRAATLAERFAGDHPDSHGNVTRRTPEELDDLVLYLETL